MAYMEFCDKHNMVAFLGKPTRSEDFHQIADFLAGSNIRYSLTANPTIFVSLIKQFWQTATVRTFDDGEQHITATVDGTNFTITKASVRRHLQLADADGISNLPNTEIFDNLTLMGVTSLEGDLKDKAALWKGHHQASEEGQTVGRQGVEITLDQTGGDFQIDFDAGVYNVGMITPTRASEQEKAHGQGSPDIDLGVLSAAKVLVDASRERPKTYTRRRRSTGSSGDGTTSTVVGLISIAGALPQIDPKDKGKAILIEPEKPKKVRRRDIRPDQVAADAELARRLQEEELAELERLEMARAAAREKQEKTDFDKALKLQRQIDEKEEATEEDVDWNAVAEQIERHKGHSEAIKRYQALKIKPVQTLYKKDSEVEKPKTKRVAEETLLQERFKKLKTTEGSSEDQEQPAGKS
ncbi:hypothetical protein Tco_1329269 [Tanacetum coccineum]